MSMEERLAMLPREADHGAGEAVEGEVELIEGGELGNEGGDGAGDVGPADVKVLEVFQIGESLRDGADEVGEIVEDEVLEVREIANDIGDGAGEVVLKEGEADDAADLEVTVDIVSVAAAGVVRSESEMVGVVEDGLDDEQGLLIVFVAASGGDRARRGGQREEEEEESEERREGQLRCHSSNNLLRIFSFSWDGMSSWTGNTPYRGWQEWVITGPMIISASCTARQLPILRARTRDEQIFASK